MRSEAWREQRFRYQHMTEPASAEVGGELPRWVGLWKSEKQWSVVGGSVKPQNEGVVVVAAGFAFHWALTTEH